MPLTVLHIINNLELGGAQVVVKQITENPAPDVRHIIFPLRCGQMPLAPNAEIITHNLPPYHPGKLKKLSEIGRDQKVDIIHAHLHKSIIAGMLIKNKTNTKLIAHEHGPIFHKGLDFSLYRLFIHCLKKRIDHTIAVSTPIENYLYEKIHISKDKITLIPNAVDLERFIPEKYNKHTCRQELGLPKKVTLIGFLGRLSKIKGSDIALETLNQLRKKNIPSHLAFAGTGPMMEILKEKAKTLKLSNQTHYLGHIDDVPAFLAACDIGLMPSRQDAFPVSTVEWLAMGIPLVTSGADGISDVTKHEENALINSTNTPEEHARAIENLLNDPDLKTKLIENARKTAGQYSLQNFLKKINALYTNLAGK